MQSEEALAPADAIRDIRGIMERSAKFISLSGWSGVWAGCVALLGASLAYYWLPVSQLEYSYMLQPAPANSNSLGFLDNSFYKPLLLALAIFIVAVTGGYYFTWRKVHTHGGRFWNHASRQMCLALALPLIAGAIFCLGFMRYGHTQYIAAACLIFYGLALINAGKYTISEIRYLGLLEVLLGSFCLFMPGYGLYFWAAGFGLLHILYGIIMWNKYDKPHSA